MLNFLACANRPGGARRLVTFFCFAKRKSPKKRRAAVRATALRCVVPCAARMSRKFQKLVCCAAFGHLKFLSVSSCAAQPCQNGTVGAGTDTGPDSAERIAFCSPNPNPIPFSFSKPVLAGPSSADGGGRSGQTCLSRRRVVWTAAGIEQRRLPVAQRRDPDCGSPFFPLGFFGETKKGNSPAGARPGLVIRAKNVISASAPRPAHPC